MGCVGVGYAEGCHSTGPAPTPTPTPTPSTDKLQVVGDAIFPVTLSGNQGQLALQDCYDTTPGYNAETGECELDKDAWCHEDTGICSPAWGPAPTPTPTPTPTPPPSTDELYVVGDATFPVTLTGDQKLCGAGGNRCPDKGAETPTNCDNLSFSYDFDAKKCILKQDTWCWGDRCVHHDFDNAMKVIEDNGNGKLLGTFQVDLKEGEKLCGQGGN